MVEFCCILGRIYYLGFLIVNLKLVLKLFLLKLIYEKGNGFCIVLITLIKILFQTTFECLNRIMDEFSKNYDNVIFFSFLERVQYHDNAMTSFCSLDDLTILIDQPTCYKNPDKPTCIDLILTNHPYYFQKNNVFETGLSNLLVIVVTGLKMGFQKLKPHITVIINTLMMKSFDQTFKVVPQKKN